MAAHPILLEATRTVVSCVPNIEPLLFCVPLAVLPDNEFAARHGDSFAVMQSKHTACAGPDFIHFQESFFTALSPAKRAGLVIHEVLHPSLGHISDPFRDPTITAESFARLRNQAQDTVIELSIDKMRTQTMAGKVTRIEANWPREVLDSPEVRKYAGWSWVSVYEDMRANATVVPPIDGHQHGPHGDTVETQLSMAREESEAIDKAAGCVKGQGAIEVKIEEASVPWHQTLKEWATSFVKSTSNNWAHPKRRTFASKGIYRPVKRYEKKLDAVNVFIDSSGSMGEILGKISGDWKSVCAIADRVRLVEYDVGVQRTLILHRKDIDAFDFGKYEGGGGTSLDDAIANMKAVDWRIEGESLLDGAPLIIYTDSEDAAGCYARLIKALKPKQAIVVLPKGTQAVSGLACLWLN